GSYSCSNTADLQLALRRSHLRSYRERQTQADLVRDIPRREVHCSPVSPAHLQQRAMVLIADLASATS
ncbi:hypothetical protein, partial [Pseudomonas nitroreducens]|uniref:hypothetical protein n=1 Tax=Pseudomonas nitroreducens TaxID=46680 RepID=UPI001C8797CA